MVQRITGWIGPIFKRALPWLIVFFVAFLLGFLLSFFLLYRPVATKLAQAKQDLEQIVELEAEIDSLNEQLSATRSDLQALEDETTATELHIHLLSALADVYAAQASLANEDPGSARAYLTQTPETLEAIANLLDPGQEDVATSMQNRLQQVLDEMDSDQYAAQSDLDVLANNLTQLEMAYFGGP
jgi:chromosome segregation ATPase